MAMTKTQRRHAFSPDASAGLATASDVDGGDATEADGGLTFPPNAGDGRAVPTRSAMNNNWARHE